MLIRPSWPNTTMRSLSPESSGVGRILGRHGERHGNDRLGDRRHDGGAARAARRRERDGQSKNQETAGRHTRLAWKENQHGD